MSKQKGFSLRWLLLIVFILFLTFYQLPFYISTPGMAKELAPIVEVEGGYDEQGSFSLTTIRMGRANIVQYGLAKLNEYHVIYREEQLRPEGETDDEYNHRQLHLMENSKEQATVVAYTKANKDISIEYNGVYVMGIVAGMPAEEHLEIGDRLYAVDNQEMKSAEEFIAYVSSKNAGDTVALKLERRGEFIEVDVPLGLFPEEVVNGEVQEERAGLGIQLVTDRKVEVNPKVDIKTDEIGGPSAGLMFTLEIYNQLVEEDITKGYKIAGTGTIDYEGVVGRIGGIKQKVVAADSSEVDIFFAPNEEGKVRVDQDGASIPTNYQDALEAAQDIDSDMKIVPVDTFDEALKYLEQLEPKK